MTVDGSLGPRSRVPEEAGPDTGPAKRKRGRPGSDDSRARILSSAGKLFAARGYNGVSMRELAQAAKVNLGAINYHFGGKRKLYHETVQQLIEDIGPVFGPIIRQLREDVGAAAGDRQMLASIVESFLRSMFHAVLGKRSMRWQMAFLLREFHQPSREFPMILRDRIGPMHDAVGLLVATALRRDPEDESVRLGAQALIGQIMSFGACRLVVCARLGWDDYNRERIDFIAATLIPATLASLDLPLAPAMPEGGPS